MSAIKSVMPASVVMVAFVLLVALVPGKVLGGGVFEAAKPIFPSANQYKLVYKSPPSPPGKSPVIIKSPSSPFKGSILQTAVITVAPCGVIGAHVHPRATEHGYVIKGQLKFGIFLEDGTARFVTVKQGEGVILPQGSIHYVQNTACTKAEVLVVFDHPNGGTVFAGAALVNFPASYLKSAFNAIKGPAPNLFFSKPCACKLG